MKNYRIKNFSDDDVKPEETFFDSIQNHASLEEPISSSVFNLVNIIIAIVLVLFIAKAFQLQILNGEIYQKKISRDSTDFLSSFSLRGIIYDTRNKPLVENVPVLQAIIVPSELEMASESHKWASASQLLQLSDLEIQDKIKKNKNESSAIIKKNIEKDVALKLKDLNISGLYTAVDAQRNYIYGESMAHILGYTGKVNKSDLENDNFYLINDRIGRSGIEAFYEENLRGEHSQLIFDSNTKDGNNNISSQGLKTGSHLVLTIDATAQKKLSDLMSYVFKNYNISRGAGVVQKTSTGEIVAMVSMPNFDPNAFQGLSKDADYITSLFNDKDRPLFNRIIGGKYVPGSTIKPLYALAVLREGVIDPMKLIYSAGSITVSSIYDSSIKYTFRDWKKHGWTDVRKAIADSVDIYFYAVCGGLSGPGYETIKGIGIEKMVQYLSDFKLNEKLGIDLPGEAIGFIPTPEWKKETKKEPWLIGDTYNTSIGQGDLLVTPLWINTYISALANGGLIMKPFIVRQILNNDGTQLKSTASEVIADLPIADKNLDIVRSGMRQTITDGTAKRLNDLPVSVAGKTGTAQVSSGKKLNSLFTAYAPYENPEIAITIVVEDIPADSQSIAVEIAKLFLGWYFTDYKNS